MDEDWYLEFGKALGSFAALATFVGCWIYCWSEYGFLLGFGLGWIPSFIASSLAYGITTYLWGPAAILGVALLFYLKFL